MMNLTYDLRGGIAYVSGGKCVRDGKPLLHQRRTLDTYVLFFGVSGELPMTQNGREYLLTPGKFMLLPKGLEHYGTAPSTPDLTYYWCHFRLGEGVRLTEGRLPFPEPDLLVLPEIGEARRTERVRARFHQLIDAALGNGCYRARAADATLTLLLLELADDAAAGEGNASLAAHAAEWIRLHAAEIRSVNEVAENFGYNCEYLTTALHRATGRTLVEHLRDARVQLACRMLLEDDIPVAEVAYRCGFSDEKYFSKVFKKATDLTPTQYRGAYYRVHYNR